MGWRFCPIIAPPGMISNNTRPRQKKTPTITTKTGFPLAFTKRYTTATAHSAHKAGRMKLIRAIELDSRNRSGVHLLAFIVRCARFAVRRFAFGIRRCTFGARTLPRTTKIWGGIRRSVEKTYRGVGVGLVSNRKFLSDGVATGGCRTARNFGFGPPRRIATAASRELLATPLQKARLLTEKAF
jgi:hypothetical protein